MSNHIDDRNYYNDSRTRALARGPNTKEITFTEYTEDDVEIEHTMPSCWGVCSMCNGNGTVVSPSIDAGGLSGEEFYDDPDFAEDYKNGVYDIACPNCNGLRVERVLDEANCDPELLKKFREWQAEQYISERERAAELMWGY